MTSLTPEAYAVIEGRHPTRSAIRPARRGLAVAVVLRPIAQTTLEQAGIVDALEIVVERASIQADRPICLRRFVRVISRVEGSLGSSR
jgi:hypothetical protein